MRSTGLFSAVALCAMLAAPAAALAEPAQPLAITFHGDGARATQLATYDPAQPIAVTVRESSGAAIDAVSVLAAGPDGESLDDPLVRSADGSFTGSLQLPASGTWHVRLTARGRQGNVDTSPVTLDVAPPPPSNAWEIGLAVGLGIFAVFGGGGFIVLRRTVRTHGASAQAA